MSTATIFGQVMFLVAIAIGFLTLGAYVGRDLEYGTAMILSFTGFGMLLVSNFVGALRTGPVAMLWLFATSLVIGLGLGPVLTDYLNSDPTAVAQAAGGTALITLGMGSLGFVLSKDLRSWMRPLSFIVFGAVGVSIVMFIVGAGSSPIINIIILGVSSLLILVDFNYVRKHATEDDVVWLATGIFVSIVNIFLSLLSLFGNR
ncbi:MAG: US12 family protein [Solirubrobacteraceae bacterium]|nr:US12 family protein [Solirubrobacteraceae bacterium]